MRRSASEVIRNLESRIARLEKQSALADPDERLADFVSDLQRLLGRGVEIDTQKEDTEDHGSTYTIFINPFFGERKIDFFMTRGGRYKGYMPTPELKKKVGKVTRSFKKAIKMADGNVVIGLDGQLNTPTMRKSSSGQKFYDSYQADYRWELFVYID